eukprot:7453201-Pyramimonas_sp.AAC.2
MGLCEDVEAGDLEAVRRRIVEGGEDPDTTREGESALFIAATVGESEVCEFLLSKGAAVNLEDSYGDAPINRGVCYPAVLEVLIARGCDLEHKDSEGAYPLHNAVQGGCVKAVRMLLEKGAKADTIGEGMGYTALHEAALGNMTEIIKELLEGTDALGFSTQCIWQRGNLN